MLWLVRTTPGAYDTNGPPSRASGHLWGYGALMLRPRARVGRAQTLLSLPRRSAAPVIGLVLGLLLASGCGSDSGEKKSAEPSKAALDCRESWKDLKDDVKGRGSLTYPSALAPKWNGILAAANHYTASATADDCGKTISNEKKTIAALTAFGAKLRPYDMEYRLQAIQEDAEAYASGPRPPAPEPSPAKKGKKKAKKPPRPPKPADIKAALATLTKQAPLATEQQTPAWQQARAGDVTDTAAVKKAVKDLAFLSSESKAYAAASAALAEIRPALKAAQD